MNETDPPPSIEVLREQAIANIYHQLAHMQFDTGDDACDAAIAIQKLTALGNDDSEQTLKYMTLHMGP